MRGAFGSVRSGAWQEEAPPCRPEPGARLAEGGRRSPGRASLAIAAGDKPISEGFMPKPLPSLEGGFLNLSRLLQWCPW